MLRKLQEATRTYYYDESDESKFEQRIVDGETIFTLPTMYVTEEAEKQKNEPVIVKQAFDKALLDKVVKIYFGVGQSNLDEKYNSQLDQLLEYFEEQ